MLFPPGSDDKRRLLWSVLDELDIYQEKLRIWGSAAAGDGTG